MTAATSKLDAALAEAGKQASGPLPPRAMMSDEGIVAFAREMPEVYIACRQGQRHDYGYTAPKDKIFTTDEFGYDIWTSDCRVCGEAYREERWLIREHKKTGVILAMRLISATTKYHKQEDGSRSDYLLPKGTGYVPGRMLLEAYSLVSLGGHKVRRGA